MDERILFAMFYSGLVAMQFHPRNAKKFHEYSLDDLADVAQSMVRISYERFPDGPLTFEHSQTMGG